jgi:hypothetical protein
MPWEGTELYVADVVNSESGFYVTNTKHIAGKKLYISAVYPSWVTNNTLVFTSDVSGYQNPWTYSTITQTARPAFASHVSEDFSGPQWFLGGSPYAIIDASGDSAVFAAFSDGHNVLYRVDLRGWGTPIPITPCPFVTISSLCQFTPGKPEFVFLASKSDGPGGIIQCTLSSWIGPVTYKTLKSTQSSDSGYPAGIISPPCPSMLPIPNEENLLPVVLYKPTNPAYDGSSIPGEKPPCVLNVHGGKHT